MKIKEPYNLVVIRWEDHCANSAWETQKEAVEAKVGVFDTVGWLVGEDRKKVVVCQCLEIGGDKLVGNRSTIIKKNIVDRHEIVMTS